MNTDVCSVLAAVGWEKGRAQNKLGTNSLANDRNAGTIYCTNDKKPGTV